MSAKFLEGFSGKFAEQWIATLLTPAFVFWAGGAIATLQRIGWTKLSSWFMPLPEPLQIASILGLFLTLSTSAFIVQRFDLAVLQLLEGYWHPRLNWFSQQLIQHQLKAHRKHIELPLRKLNDRGLRNLTAPERNQHFQLSFQFEHFPDPADLMPTRLGNILRAAERRPLEKYGLDAIIC